MSYPSVIPASDGKAYKDFLRLPWKIYNNNPLWVPPLLSEVKKILSPKKNVFWQNAERELFVAYRDGSPVGRIAAIVSHNHNKTHDEKTGFFGFFECENDEPTAHALFDKAAEWLIDKEMNKILGPENPSINDDLGFLLEGEEKPPVIMMPYNPPYYLELAESWGMVKAKDLYAFYIDRSIEVSDKVLRIADRVRKRGNIKIRSFNMKDFKNEVEKVKMVYNKAWAKNWGAVAMTDAEFDQLAADFKRIVIPDLALILEIDGQTAGFSLAIPNLNQVFAEMNGRLLPFGIFKILRWRKKVDSIRLIIMGVLEEFRNRGAETLFYVETYKRAVNLGMKWAEMSWNLEDNVLINKGLETMGAKLYKKYRLFEKAL